MSYLIWHPDLPLPARLPYGVLVAAAIGLMPDVVAQAARAADAARSSTTGSPRRSAALATRTIRWAMTSDPSVAARLQAERERAVPGLGAAGA